MDIYILLGLIFTLVLYYQYRVRKKVEQNLKGSAMALKAAASAAKQGEERFRLMVDSMPSAVLMIDSKGAIVIASARAEEMFGYSRTELIGLPFELLQPVRFRIKQAAFRDSFLQNIHTRPIGMGSDLYCLRKNGEEVPVEIGLSPLKMGGEVFVLASIVDMSERRKSQSEMERQRNQLTHLTRVEMLSHFTGSLAHELNQPLTAIMTNAQVAKRMLEKPDIDTTELQAIMDDLIADNRRASEIVVRLRGWLKRESHRTADHDLNALVREVVHFFKSEFMFHKTKCRLDLEKVLAPVHCDRVQIQQVVVNLLKNALETNRIGSEGDREILIRTTNTEDGDAVISIRDDGDGIPESVKRELFQPFMTTKKTGLGMGLSICQTIVLDHKGRIWAENNAEGGATFHVALPAIARILV